MKVSFARLYHAATDSSLAWPEPVQRWADADPAHAHLLRNIRALLPGHPANATTVTALVKEVLAEMERVPEPDSHDERGKALSGKELPAPEADPDLAVASGKAEPLASPVDRVSGDVPPLRGKVKP